MNEFLHEHAAVAKLALMAGLIVVLALWQWLGPRRRDASLARWRVNLGMIAVSTLVTRLILPVSMVVAAAWAQAHQFGLFNTVAVPTAIGFVLSLIVLDFAIYWQHRAFHAVPLLWRAHRVHHTDLGFDVSLGLRFHPLEILPSAFYKICVVVALGASPLAAGAYELVLLAMSLFTHADVALPRRWDAALRWLIVTPDWHRVHHSIDRAETDSNYGNWLSVWDRVFGTYIAQPRDGHAGMRIGLPVLRNPGQQTLVAGLVSPLLSETQVLENNDA
ncbi:sterol desaturase family protein [soil metagenome]